MDATADDFGYGDGANTGSGFSDFHDRMSEWGNEMQERVRINQKRENARDLGRFAEEGAAKTGSAADNKSAERLPFAAAVDRARNAEQSGGSFANNVQGLSTLEKAAIAKASPGAKILLEKAKKGGPFATILVVVAILVTMFAGSQTFAAFSFVENGLDQFNNLRTAMNRRSTYFTRFAMRRDRNNPITKASIFSPEKFKISNKMSKKLAKQGVYYVDNSDFDCRFLLYEDAETGKTYAVAANDVDAGKLPSGGVDVEVNGEMRHFDISDSGRMKLDDALVDSKNLTRSVDVGTRTLKGHVAGWFDDVSAKLHERIISSRNKRKNVAKDADEDEVKRTARGVDEGLPESIAETKRNNNEEDDPKVRDQKQKLKPDGSPELDENNKPVMVDYEKPVPIGDDAIPKNPTQAQMEDGITNRVSGTVAAMGKGANIYCTVMKAYSMLSAVVAGVMVANILNYITGFLEAIQKTQTGDAGAAELSYYMTGLSQKGRTLDSEGEVIDGKDNTSSLESPAWNQFFSSGSLVVSPSDKAAQKFNRDYYFKESIGQAPGIVGTIAASATSITDTLLSGADAYKACLTAQVAAAGAEFVSNLVVAFMSFGFGAFIKKWATDLLESATHMIIVGAITAAMFMVIPHLAQWMAMDLISNMAGEDAAYAINSGMNIYLGRQMQASSGLPASEDKLMAHWREQQEVIAEEGALERSMRSPFDVTSKYTFLGSIFNSLMPIANTWSTPLTTVLKTMNTVANAAAGLLPTARADGEVKFETSINRKCPTLSSIGLVGDAYCNPYFVTDFSTMAADPADVFAIVAGDKIEIQQKVGSSESTEGSNDNFIWDNVDDAEHNGNPDINPTSKLGKWVVACSIRDSQFGQVDSNVMNVIAGLFNTGNSAVDMALEQGLGMVPFVEDVTQIASAAKEAANLNWATGENCASEDYKWYSRYSEDQRMMESAGIIERSAVAKFLDEYYEKNPIDNSYEGIIARYSGYTKDEVIAFFDDLEYIAWYNNYNPEMSGPLKYEEKPDGSYQYESNEIVSESETVVLGNYIVFDDLRTKTKIA